MNTPTSSNACTCSNTHSLHCPIHWKLTLDQFKDGVLKNVLDLSKYADGTQSEGPGESPSARADMNAGIPALTIANSRKLLAEMAKEGSMSLTVIIQNYYEERQEYWPQIYRGVMQTSTVKPDRLMIWDNMRVQSMYSRCRLLTPYHVTSYNTLLGRYAAILLAATDYVFVQDNDLVVGPDTIERLFSVAQKNPEKIVGIAGCRLAYQRADSGAALLPLPEQPYSKATWVKEGPVDVVLGRCWLAHRKALAPGFSRILSENIQPGRSDDIFFSMCAGGGIVVPCSVTNLDEKGVGLSHEPQHFVERDEMARRMLQ